MPSFDKMATETLTTKRSPAMVDGKRGEREGYLTDPLPCLPLDTVDPDTRASMGISAPVELKQTIVHGSYDIENGDVAIVDSVEYNVRSVAEYEWKGSIFRQLFLEEPKSR